MDPPAGNMGVFLFVCFLNKVLKDKKNSVQISVFLALKLVQNSVSPSTTVPFIVPFVMHTT